jgi:hypothetical protein
MLENGQSTLKWIIMFVIRELSLTQSEKRAENRIISECVALFTLEESPSK